MLNLEDRGAYRWYYLFLFLSLEKSEPFLSHVEFPLEQELVTVRKLAKKFILGFYDIQPHLFRAGELSDVAHQLFNDTYRQCETELGQEQAESLCKWGNQLLMDSDLEYSMDAIWGKSLVPLTSGVENEPSIPDQKLDHLRTIISQQDNTLKSLYFTLDSAEESPSDAWEDRANDMYNRGNVRDNSEVSVSMNVFDQLEAAITFVKIRSALLKIKETLDQQELEALDRWIQSRPEWIKTQQRGRRGYLKPFSLGEVLSHLSG